MKSPYVPLFQRGIKNGFPFAVALQSFPPLAKGGEGGFEALEA